MTHVFLCRGKIICKTPVKAYLCWNGPKEVHIWYDT